MLAAAGGPWYGEGRCCAVVAFSSHASICGDFFISWGTRFSPYGDTVNLSRCFYFPAIFTLSVNPQQQRGKTKKASPGKIPLWNGWWGPSDAIAWTKLSCGMRDRYR